jgi:hypothetical protein
MTKLLPHLLVALCATAAVSLRADFSGAYDLGSSNTYSLVSGVTTPVGQWNALLTTGGSGGSGSVNTSSAPAAVTLSTTGNAETGTGSVAFRYTFTSPGSVAFSYTVNSFGGAFNVQLDSVTQTASGSNYSFAVSSGQVLAINLSATGTMSTMMPMGFDPVTMMPSFFFMPGFPQTETVTISNFSGPSAIPEPSSFALAGGLGALAFATLRRRRA